MSDNKDMVTADAQGYMRKADGRFAPGTRAGPGRAISAVRSREYLSILLEECTPERWRDIVNRAIDDAIEGNWRARKWLSDYLIGPMLALEARIKSSVDSTTHEHVTQLQAIIAQVLPAAMDDGQDAE